jgi:RHS repeat-associated protein
MLPAAKEENFSAPMVWTDECVLPLAASGVYPKTRVRGSEEKMLPCFGATAPLRIELRWGCENSSGKTAAGSALDSNGNTLTSVTGSNTTTYAWDFENRLTSVTLPGSGGTVTFACDPFGRRIKKVTSTATSIYAYDGDNLIEETNSSGAAIARYSQTQNIDEPLAMLRSGATSYFHADGLGSVTSLSNTAGSIANTYTYDSFGKLTASTGSLVNPFQYTARESDTETGLYYYRARYYDQNAGRFLSEDQRDATPRNQLFNLYLYVLGNPVNLTDPLGQFILKPGEDLPWPNLRLQALLECIEFKTGLSLVVTSTTEPPPKSPHGPNDPHRRNGGLAVDIHYPIDPEFVLHAAACCGAVSAKDEKRHPSIHSNAAHIHLQLVPGPDPGNPGGDLPRNVKCGCS